MMMNRNNPHPSGDCMHTLDLLSSFVVVVVVVLIMLIMRGLSTCCFDFILFCVRDRHDRKLQQHIETHATCRHHLTKGNKKDRTVVLH